MNRRSFLMGSVALPVAAGLPLAEVQEPVRYVASRSLDGFVTLQHSSYEYYWYTWEEVGLVVKKHHEARRHDREA